MVRDSILLGGNRYVVVERICRVHKSRAVRAAGVHNVFDDPLDLSGSVLHLDNIVPVLCDTRYRSCDPDLVWWLSTKQTLAHKIL